MTEARGPVPIKVDYPSIDKISHEPAVPPPQGPLIRCAASAWVSGAQAVNSIGPKWGLKTVLPGASAALAPWSNMFFLLMHSAEIGLRHG